MRAALLAALLALPAGAQSREVLEVRDGYVRGVDGGTVQVRGGAYLPPESLLATGRELASLRAENAALKEAPVAPPSSLAMAVVVGLAVGLAGGAATTLWLVRR